MLQILVPTSQKLVQQLVLIVRIVLIVLIVLIVALIVRNTQAFKGAELPVREVSAFVGEGAVVRRRGLPASRVDWDMGFRKGRCDVVRREVGRQQGKIGYTCTL